MKFPPRINYPEQNDIIALLPLLSTLNISHFFLVFTVDFEHAVIFWVWSFYISIASRLRWIKASFIYRKDFHEAKYLYEVKYSPPRLFFRNLFEISKLQWVNSVFFLMPSINSNVWMSFCKVALLQWPFHTKSGNSCVNMKMYFLFSFLQNT